MSDHERGPQDHPIEVLALQRLLGGMFGAGETRILVGADAHRRDQDHAAHACPRASGGQGTPAFDMNLVGGIGGGVLQDAGAIHHRVDAREMLGPMFGLAGAREIDLDPTQVGAALARRLDAATGAHDLMAVGDEPRDHGRSDETIGADDENPHDARDFSPRRPFARAEIASSVDPRGPGCRPLRYCGHRILVRSHLMSSSTVP